jgi:hypothetical protein
MPDYRCALREKSIVVLAGYPIRIPVTVHIAGNFNRFVKLAGVGAKRQRVQALTAVHLLPLAGHSDPVPGFLSLLRQSFF